MTQGVLSSQGVCAESCSGRVILWLSNDTRTLNSASDCLVVNKTFSLAAPTFSYYADTMQSSREI